MAETRLHKIASAPCDRLLHAINRGDVTAATAVLDADPLVYLKLDQGKALLKACVTAPNAVALLDLFHARRSTLFRGTTKHLADRTLLHACQHGANVATVQRAVEILYGNRRPNMEKGLLWATKTRNGPLVEHLLTSYEPNRHRDYGTVLLTAIDTKSQAFALRVMVMPAVQAFLASLETSFDPCFIREAATHHQPHEWLGRAIARGMHAVVECAGDRAPLFTSDAVYRALFPTGASEYEHFCARRVWLNGQIEAFHQAIDTGHVVVVYAMLDDVPALGRSSMDNGETALMASALAPNSIALLKCLRQLGVTNKAVRGALFRACGYGATAATAVYLWKWVESFNMNEGNRDTVLWDAISRAILGTHFTVLNALLRCGVRDWTSSRIQLLLAKRLSGWPSHKAEAFFTKAMTSVKNTKFVCALMEVPVMQEAFKSVDDNLAWAAPPDMVFRCHESYCQCSDRFCDIENAVSTVVSWIETALELRMVSVAYSLDKWWPALTREAAFLHCQSNDSIDAGLWSDLCQRYVRDVTWYHTRGAHLVQRRRLPGLDPLGSHIAAYLYTFEPESHLNFLHHESSDSEESDDYHGYGSDDHR